MRKWSWRCLRSFLGPGLLAVVGIAGAAGNATPLPSPTVDLPAASGTGLQTAVFAGGCFWGVEGVFRHVKGVKTAVSGYAGGTATTATYDTVSTGGTRHA